LEIGEKVVIFYRIGLGLSLFSRDLFGEPFKINLSFSFEPPYKINFGSLYFKILLPALQIGISSTLI